MHVLTWAELKCFYDHVPHGSTTNVLVQHSGSFQIRLSTQSVFGCTQSFLLQFLIWHAFNWRLTDRELQCLSMKKSGPENHLVTGHISQFVDWTNEWRRLIQKHFRFVGTFLSLLAGKPGS